jgi:hypothetical protein
MHLIDLEQPALPNNDATASSIPKKQRQVIEIEGTKALLMRPTPWETKSPHYQILPCDDDCEIHRRQSGAVGRYESVDVADLTSAPYKLKSRLCWNLLGAPTVRRSGGSTHRPFDTPSGI